MSEIKTKTEIKKQELKKKISKFATKKKEIGLLENEKVRVKCMDTKDNEYLEDFAEKKLEGIKARLKDKKELAQGLVENIDDLINSIESYE